MIRRYCLLFIVFSFSVFTIGAQEELIPRRVRIVADEGAEGSLLPSILYARLTRRVPLVVSGPDDEPHNNIIINFGEDFSVILEDRDGVIDSREFPPDIAEDPSFVSREMIETLRPAAAQVVEATASAEAQAQGTRGMVFAPMEEPAAAELLGPLAHAEAADALIPVLSDHEH